jgi:competence protein ComEA
MTPMGRHLESDLRTFLLGARFAGLYNLLQISRPLHREIAMDPAAGAIKSGEPPRPSTPAEPAPALPSSTTVQLALCVLIVAALFFFIGRWTQNTAATPVLAQHPAGPALDLNRATRAELRLIPGLGDALAQRVIEHRQRIGRFDSVDDLREVHGIGVKTLERIRPHLFVTRGTESLVSTEDSEPMPDAPSKPASMSRGAPGKKEAALTGPININRANQTDLQKLPGIGPKLSQRILDERARASFKSIDELRRVSGIGPKTLEKLRPHVTIE